MKVLLFLALVRVILPEVCNTQTEYTTNEIRTLNDLTQTEYTSNEIRTLNDLTQTCCPKSNDDLCSCCINQLKAVSSFDSNYDYCEVCAFQVWVLSLEFPFCMAKFLLWQILVWPGHVHVVLVS